MQEPNRLNPAEREVEDALRTLTPTAARIDSVAAAFAAGERSTKGQLQRWRVAAAALLLVSAGSWIVPASEEVGRVTPTAVSIATNVTNKGFTGPSAQSLVALRYAIDQQGIEGMPTTRVPAFLPMRSKDVL